jgi:hypothetical protein
MNTQRIPLAKITLSTKLQARFSGTDDEVIEDYMRATVKGDKFPPITVFHVGDQYLLVDGFHRVSVYTQLGMESVECEVIEGEYEQDAIDWVWCNANRKNGQRLSRKDLRYMIYCMVSDERYSSCSNRQIAELMNVSHNTVASVRQEYNVDNTVIIGGDGKTYRFDRTPRTKNVYRFPETHPLIQKYELSSKTWENLPPKVKAIMMELMEGEE